MLLSCRGRKKFRYRTEPYEHQRVALEKSYDKKNFGYFMEMGCGKSKVLLDNITWLYDNKLIDTAIIVAPKGVYRNWQVSEIPTHLPEDIDPEIYVWSANPNKTQRERLSKGLRSVISSASCWSTWKDLERRRRSLNMWISLHKARLSYLRSMRAQLLRTPRPSGLKLWLSLVRVQRTNVFLPDRPLLNRLWISTHSADLWTKDCSASIVTTPSKVGTLSRGLSAWVRTAFQQIVGYRMLEELSDKLAGFPYRVTKDEALDLPDKIYTTREVYCTKEQIQYYHSIKTAAIALLDDGQLVSAPAVMTQLLRLQQVLCGHLMTDDGELVEFPTKRIDALLDTVEEMSGKVIIWSRFRYDIRKMAVVLESKYGPGSTVNYFGDTSDADRQEAIKQFQFGDARFFVANPQTAGYGLTLTAATNVIYYANDFNLETRVQSEDRAHRIGQHHPVTYVDLMTKGTVDVHIVKSLPEQD